MPTVDDLMISLTIKPTSNLGRLQKQLDAIVGRTGKGMRMRGVGTGFMYLKKDMTTIKNSINEIEKRMRVLTPTKIGGRGEEALNRVFAGGLINMYKDVDLTELMRKVQPAAGALRKNFAEMMGVAETELPEKMAEEFEATVFPFLDAIRREIIGGTDRGSQEVLRLVKKIFMEQDVPIRLTDWTKLQSALGEQNILMEKVLKTGGLNAIFEGRKGFSGTLAGLRPIWLEDKLDEVTERVADWAEKEGIDVQEENTIAVLAKIVRETGIDAERLWRMSMNEIKSSEKVMQYMPELIATMFAEGKGGGVPLAFRDLIAQMLKKVDDSFKDTSYIKKMWEIGKPDLLLFQADAEKLIELGMEKTAKLVQDKVFYWLEQKSAARERAMAEEIPRFSRLVGKENLSVIAEYITGPFKKLAEMYNIPWEKINVWDMAEKLDLIKNLTEEEKELLEIERENFKTAMTETGNLIGEEMDKRDLTMEEDLIPKILEEIKEAEKLEGDHSKIIVDALTSLINAVKMAQLTERAAGGKVIQDQEPTT